MVVILVVNSRLLFDFGKFEGETFEILPELPNGIDQSASFPRKSQRTLFFISKRKKINLKSEVRYNLIS